MLEMHTYDIYIYIYIYIHFLALENAGIEKNVCNFRVGWFLKHVILYLRASLRVLNLIVFNIIKNV